MYREEFLKLLIQISDDFRIVYDNVRNDWSLEDPSGTIVFSAFGYCIAEIFLNIGESINKDVFLLIERAITDGDDNLKALVATGLIEGLVARAVQKEGLWLKIAPFLGRQSLLHAKAWLM